MKKTRATLGDYARSDKEEEVVKKKKRVKIVSEEERALQLFANDD